MNLSAPFAAAAVYQRRLMTYTCRVRREEQTGTDDYGNPTYERVTVTGEQACWPQIEQSRQAVDETRTALVTDAKLWFPLDADVQSGDELDQVVDHDGATFLPGVWRIEGHVLPHRTYVEAAIERIGG